MTSPSPTTFASVKSIVAAFEFARMQRELERRRQRLEKLFTTTSVASATPSPAPLASLSSPASSTTPPPPTINTSTSIDNTTLSSTTTREPLQTPPARCSMPGHTHDESTLVPVSAASAPSSTSLRASSAPSAAPTFSGTTAAVLCAVEVFTTMPTRCSTICPSHDSNMHKSYSFERSQQRYITNYNSIYLNGVVYPCLSTRLLDVQKVYEGMGVPKPAILTPVPATLVDKGQGPAILNVKQVCIPPKPPWSLGSLQDDSPNGDFATQVTWMLCSYLLKDSITLLIDNVQCRPIPWPLFTNNSVVVGSPVSTLFGNIGGWYLQHCLEFTVKCCGMQWAIPWTVLLTLHQKKVQLAMATVPSMQSLLLLDCHSLVSSDEVLLIPFTVSSQKVLLDPLHVQVLGRARWPAQANISIFLLETSSVTSQLEMQVNDVQLRPTPWPSFDLLTAVQLERYLSYSWHIVQLVKLYLDDRRLFHFVTELFLLAVHLLNSLPVVFVNGTTEVHALGCCQMNTQLKAPPNWPGSSYCQDQDWYLLQKNGVCSWVSDIAMFQLHTLLSCYQWKQFCVTSTRVIVMSLERDNMILLLAHAGNFVCHHYWLIQIKFRCTGMRYKTTNANCPVAHMWVTSFKAIQLDEGFVSFACPSTYSACGQQGWRGLLVTFQYTSMRYWLSPVDNEYGIFASFNWEGAHILIWPPVQVHGDTSRRHRFSYSYSCKLMFAICYMPWNKLSEQSTTYSDQFSSTQLHSRNYVTGDLLVSALKWSICWVFTDCDRIQTQPTILCEVPQLQIYLSWNQCPWFTQILLIKVYGRGGISNGRAHIAKFAAVKISDERYVLQCSPILVQFLQKLGDGLLPRIIESQQVIPWDPGGDQFFVEGFESVDGSGDLQVGHITLYFVKQIGWPYSQFLRKVLRHVMDQSSTVRNVVSNLVHILFLAVLVISTSSEQYQLIPSKGWCFHEGDYIDQARPLQSDGPSYKMPSSFSPYRVLLLNSKQWCFTQLWNPPQLPPDHDLLKGWFIEFVVNKERSVSVIEMFLWLTLPEVMSNPVLVIELTLAYMIQVSTFTKGAMCFQNRSISFSGFLQFCHQVANHTSEGSRIPQACNWKADSMANSVLPSSCGRSMTITVVKSAAYTSE